jgi:hypothetical protein
MYHISQRIKHIFNNFSLFLSPLYTHVNRKIGEASGGLDSRLKEVLTVARNSPKFHHEMIQNKLAKLSMDAANEILDNGRRCLQAKNFQESFTLFEECLLCARLCPLAQSSSSPSLGGGGGTNGDPWLNGEWIQQVAVIEVKAVANSAQVGVL